ncbi:PadR family transcriptional regulator [Euzebya sp.]|uniref:PadR family transcriptional regulator n=1 Tax=Euzebya sp. TaxID=1971409 RepID=UPI0035155732
MLDLAILGLLKERAMHGYELKRQLGQRLGFFWTVSFGSLYPTLKKLEAAGAVERLADTDGRSRRRQVYRITPDGERQFIELIEQGSSSAWEEEKFPLRFAFFRYLPTESRVWLLQRRRDYLEEKLSEGRAGLTRARRGRADPYTLSLMRHGVEQTEHDLAWIDELIAAEAGADPPDLLDPLDQPDATAPPDADDDHPDHSDRPGAIEETRPKENTR